MIQGIDISRHNKNVIFGLLPAWVEFVICKVSEGPGYVDPMFPVYWNALIGSRFRRGGYHYLRLPMDIPGQADNFIANAWNTQIPPIVDVELYQGYADDVHYHQTTPKAQIQERVLWMLEETTDRFGVDPIVYTARWYWDQFLKGARWAKKYRLHVASYKNPPPLLPSDWSTWSMWQYTEKGMVPGISTYVDLNYFNGSKADLDAICTNLDDDPGDDEMTVKFKSLVDRLRVRTLPNTNGAIVDHLDTGDEVEIDQIAGYAAWGQIANGEHAGRYVCISSQYTPLMEMVAPEPPVPPIPSIGFDSPVGTAEERAGSQVWPGDWFEAQGWGGGHTGDDLNLNVPTWDSDAHAPVYSIADGTVIFAGIAPGTWGGVVVIHHAGVYARYAHLENIIVTVGDTVTKGQQIANIGQYMGNPPNFHLHFDIADNTLATDPLNWPGWNPEFIAAHYHDPAPFIRAHRGAA